MQRCATSVHRLASWPARLRTPKSPLRCLHPRAYSLRRGLENLLAANDALDSPDEAFRRARRKSLIISSRNTRSRNDVIRSFDSLVDDRHVSAKTITRRYLNLRNASEVTATLDSHAARRLVGRLIFEKQFSILVEFLLELSLGESVELVEQSLNGLHESQRRDAILRIATVFRRLNLASLTKQMLGQLGLPTPMRFTLEQLSRMLVMLDELPAHQVEKHAEFILRASAAWTGENKLDEFSLLTLVQRANDLDMHEFTQQLVRDQGSPPEALKILLTGLPAEEAAVVLLEARDDKHAEPSWTIDSLWCSVIDRTESFTMLEKLMAHAPKHDRVLGHIATQALKFGASGQNLAVLLCHSLSARRALAVVLRSMDTSSPGDHKAILEKLLGRNPEIAEDVLGHFCRSVAYVTQGVDQRYPIDRIIAVVSAIQYPISDQLDYKLTRIMMHRSADETLAYIQLPTAPLKSIAALLAQHLRIRRLTNAGESNTIRDLLISTEEQDKLERGEIILEHTELMPDSFFVAVSEVLEHRGMKGETATTDSSSIVAAFKIRDNMLLDLARLQPPIAAGLILERIRSLSKETAAAIVRLLSRGHADILAYRTLERFVGDDYDACARFATRMAAVDGEVSMRCVAMMRARGIPPRRHLLQSLVRTLQSPDHVWECCMLAAELGIRHDKILAAALLRDTVLRQGRNTPIDHLAAVLSAAEGHRSYTEIASALAAWQRYERPYSKAPRSLQALVQVMLQRQSFKSRQAYAKAAKEAAEQYLEVIEDTELAKSHLSEEQVAADISSIQVSDAVKGDRESNDDGNDRRDEDTEKVSMRS
ncbi:hypothetical protein PYCC9005_003325 [Savitreella phatthalungensis]